MQSAEQRKSKKTVSAIVGSLIIIAGLGWFAHTQGILPGFGGGSKVARELQADIEALKGPGLQTKVVQLYSSVPNMNAENKQAALDMINSVKADFQYTELKSMSGEGKGTVEITSPKLVITSADGKSPGEISAPKLFISRDVADANHYYFHTEGGVDIYGDVNGAKSKLLTIATDQSSNELKFDPANPSNGFFKSSAKNLKLIEGRGNTVLATITDAYFESRQSISAEGKADMYAKFSYNNIIPGDMIKLMIGDLPPVSINMEYTYQGEDFTKALQAASSPGMAADYMQPFDGEGKITDFSIMMGDAGFAANADLAFSKANPEIIPTGTAQLKIAQYQKLIDYFSRFAPIPPEQVARNIAFLSEIGQNINGDITFALTFDGTKNVIIGGKTMDEIDAIRIKHFSELSPVVEGLEGTVATPPAAVESTPIGTPDAATTLTPAPAEPAPVVTPPAVTAPAPAVPASEPATPNTTPTVN